MAAPRNRRLWDDNAVLRWVRRYFGYSRGEARGMVGLLLLLLLLAVVPLALKPELPVYLPAQDQQRLDQLVASLKEHRLSDNLASRYPKRNYQPFGKGSSRYPAVPQVPLAPFDPNALTAEGWEARGVPHFVAARIVKYREAAGGFKGKAQLKKMYGLDAAVYQRLAPFMQLPDEAPRAGDRPGYAGKDGKFPPFPGGESPGRFPRKPRNLQPFDLNLADTTQLMQIRGIGPGRARWVVKYRSQLGGFVREDQLAEIFVLKDAPDLQDSLRKYTFVDPGFAPRLIKVNSASFDELYPQPYIGKRLARVLVAYRNQHGPFRRVEDLKLIPTVKAEDWEKMRPYIVCD